MEIVNTVRRHRVEMGLSQKQLATLSRVGRATISDIERGNHIPAVHIAMRIAKALDTTVEELFFENRG